jgi:addiction module HigA family antidote
VSVVPIHPGEHLAEELKELGMSASELARKLDVPTNRVTGILNGQRAITGDTALRLGHFFDEPSILAEPAKPLRTAAGEGEVRKSNRGASSAKYDTRRKRVSHLPQKRSWL